MSITEQELLKHYNRLAAIEYETVFYVVDYTNYPEDTEHGHAEIVCVNHEDEYLVDNPTSYRFRLDELVKDENLKLYVYSELKI